MSYAALPTLRTPRLTLRPLEHSDADAILDGVGNYDVSRWLGGLPYPYARDDALEFIERVHRQSLMIWAITEGGALLGVVGLDEELGYWLARPGWGKGYGFEAAHAAVAHWFANPENGDLVSGHYDENKRSRRVLSSLGFKITGHSPRFARVLAQAVPGTDVVLTRDRWQARQDFTLYTPRLTIRPIEDRDAGAFARLTVSDITRMLSRLKTGMTEAEAQANLPRHKWKGLLHFTLAIEYRGQLVGTIGVGAGPASVSYFLDPALWRQGVMTEALSATLPELFERFPIAQIFADHFEDNPASGAILRKLGFAQTGQRMATSMARVEPAPLITYALNRDDLKVPV
ncbi:GNAT family N-acetyltransferase [Rhodobacteraceae bacterium]|nr:GNAT family N-acetyltransferase [Paracoccaceae bacterium]